MLFSWILFKPFETFFNYYMVSKHAQDNPFFSNIVRLFFYYLCSSQEDWYTVISEIFFHLFLFSVCLYVRSMKALILNVHVFAMSHHIEKHIDAVKVEYMVVIP